MLDWSLVTPSLTMSSEICAKAVPPPSSVQAISAATAVRDFSSLMVFPLVGLQPRIGMRPRATDRFRLSTLSSFVLSVLHKSRRLCRGFLDDFDAGRLSVDIKRVGRQQPFG